MINGLVKPKLPSGESINEGIVKTARKTRDIMWAQRQTYHTISPKSV
jgi:hypothetical protein